MTTSDHNAIVVTGCGWVTPFSAGSIADVLTAAETSRGLQPARSSARAEASSSHADDSYWAVPDDMLGDYPGLSKEIKLDKGAWITAAAWEHARQQAGLQTESLNTERLGLVLGCGLAGQSGMIDFANEVRQQSPRFVSPIHFPQTVGNFIAGALARTYDIRGPNVTLATGSASGLDAIIEACALMTADKADVVFAGGTERLSEALAEGLSEPGVVLSEGACLLVLERPNHAAARGVRPLATVTRWDHVKPGAAAPSSPGDSARAEARGSELDGNSARAEARGSPSRGSTIVSVAGFRLENAIFIEHWIGRCIGAGGAAAVAAAIGAAERRDVPLIDCSDPSSVSIGRIEFDGLPVDEGALPALIFADADGAHRSVLELTIP